jgi:hypothetical protein
MAGSIYFANYVAAYVARILDIGVWKRPVRKLPPVQIRGAIFRDA